MGSKVTAVLLKINVLSMLSEDIINERFMMGVACLLINGTFVADEI